MHLTENAKEQNVAETPPMRPTVTYLPLPSRGLVNPFRSGTKKAKSFELFRAGGDRSSLLEAMHRLGVARSTARTWLNLFRIYARGVREAKRGSPE